MKKILLLTPSKLLFVLANIFLSTTVTASLRVYPVALEMSSQQRSSQLTVRHTYAEARWVEIEAVFFDMNTDGSMFEVAHESGINAPRSAMRILRFSPKRFLLKPGESQIVRLRTRVPSDLEDGIYRVHLKFTPDEADDVSSVGSNSSSNIQQTLKARIAIAVPIYISKGNITPQVELKQAKILSLDNQQQLQLKLLNASPDMVRGDLRAYTVNSTNNSQRQLVGKILGVASYLNERQVQFPLFEDFKKPSADSKNRLIVEFTRANDSEDVLATTPVEH